MLGLYTRLTTDALTSSYSVYQVGCVPDGTALPYVTIGGAIWGKSAQFTSRDIKGEEIAVHVHVWSAAETDVQASDMMDNIIQAVTGSDLTITGYTQLRGNPEFSQIMLDETEAGNMLRHGVIRFGFHIA